MTSNSESGKTLEVLMKFEGKTGWGACPTDRCWYEAFAVHHKGPCSGKLKVYTNRYKFVVVCEKHNLNHCSDVWEPYDFTF